MAEPFWAAAGPSRPTAASFAAVPAAAVAKKKRGRFSDGNTASNTDAAGSTIPSIIHPPSPELVPRHSSSASSWGIEGLSDSDGDHDWPTPSTSTAAQTAAHLTSPDLDRDELAKFARPVKRVHLETAEDRHTYGKLAGLQIDPTSLASSMPSTTSFGRPNGVRTNSGVAGAFGLGSSLASALAANTDVNTPAPRVPPSSPTKADAFSNPFQDSASTIYQQAIAPAPPTSPSLANRGIAPLSSPQQVYSLDTAAIPTKRANSAELQDADMRARRGNPTSFEVEPNRIVVTSLDDTSSSEGDASSPGDGQKTPDADTSTKSKESTSDFVINNELIEKLEAHSRAVLTGTSDRDNAASSSRSGTSSSQSRSRRSGRRSGGGSGIPSLGSLLSIRRRSTQSSPASSGYASPINAEDARGALILWKDPEEVLKATSATASSSPLKQSDLASVPEGNPAPSSDFMSQPPVSFESGSNSNLFSKPATSMPEIPGMAALPSPTHAVESPLYAQQSSLSSSYFPEPSPLETRFAQNAPQSALHANGSVGHAAATHSAFGASHQQQHQYQHEPQQHYGHHYGTHAPAMSTPFQHYGSSAHSTLAQAHAHNLGAQLIDLSGCFGPAEEMDLDS